jgi:hypothetical protein
MPKRNLERCFACEKERTEDQLSACPKCGVLICAIFGCSALCECDLFVIYGIEAEYQQLVADARLRGTL